MSESQYVIDSLYFIAGFIAGVALCYIAITKIFKGHRMQDELLKTRRDLANAQRSVDEFLKTSSDLFLQLDSSYRHYADFMRNASEKMGTSGSELFVPMEEDKEEDSVSEDNNLYTSEVEDSPKTLVESENADDKKEKDPEKTTE